MSGVHSQGAGRRVLVADDDADLRAVIEIVLSTEGYDVAVLEDGRAVTEMARRWNPDLVLLDVMMPFMDGVEVCRALRREPATCILPIIMLTAKGTPADVVAGLQAGADDYIMKPFDTDELLARVATTLRCSADRRGASPLTGLPGNFEILRRLERLVDAPVQDFALLQADIDSFKAFNDHYGFVRGDEAIRATARTLREVADGAEAGFVGHIGGDDFAVIVSADDAAATAEGIVSAFDGLSGGLYDPADRDRGWIEVADRTRALHRYPLLTISLGVATTASGPFASAHQAAETAAELKALAKADAGSSWRIDRRVRSTG